MAIARARLVDLSIARWYHCVTRCVRGASLLGEGKLDRRAWIEQRLAELGDLFSIAVGGFSIMKNHFVLLVDYTGRIFRNGKARMSAELAGIFEG